MTQQPPTASDPSEPVKVDEPVASADADKRERSTIGFPYDDLDSAIGVARALHARGGSSGLDELAAELKYSRVDNGAFRTRTATARTFGMLTTSRNAVSLTPVGQMVVDPTQESRGRVEAFLSVPLYKAIYERYRGNMLPPQVGLERVFADLGVAAKQTDRARQAFQRSAEQAGFFAAGKDRLVAPITSPRQTASPTPVRTPVNEQGIEPTGGGGGGGGGRSLNPFIQGLVDSLPEPGKEWSEPEREQWLSAAKSIFGLIYRTTPKQLMAPQPMSGGSIEN